MTFRMRGASLAFLVGLAGAAQAQTTDAGIEPKAANPGDDSGRIIYEIPNELYEGTAPAATPPAATPEKAPEAVVATTGPAGEDKPEESEWNLTANLAGSLRVNYGGATLFPYDAIGTSSNLNPFQTRLRVAPEIHLNNLGLFAEADAATGAILGVPADTLVGDRQPVPHLRALELRKLYLEYKWQSGAFRVGQQTSNWGLGLLANDGSRDAEAGEFGQQHYGNLTYRAIIAARPLFGVGGIWQLFETALAADLIVRDGFGEFVKGDRAFQGVLALRYVEGPENYVGVYGVYRNQRNIFVTDGGKATDVGVVDFAGKWEFMNRRSRELKIGWEMVGIFGTTTQARNENAPVLKVGEFGMAVKALYRVNKTTIYFDGGYASGDHNPADDRLENFRFDRDFKVGLVLFDQVLAYQTGRSGIRASDPNLTGVPPEGVDLLGTAGAVTGAWYLFPRVKHSATDWLDVYGGPLFAFSTAKLTDPFNTRITGGTPLNSLGGQPGGYLGTELDLGAQARFKPIPELTFTATAEGGLFLPGSAFNLPTGGVMPPVAFGRLRLGLVL